MNDDQRLRSKQTRRIAENLVNQFLSSNHSESDSTDLTNSLVRQFQTYDGHAGLFTIKSSFWYQRYDASPDSVGEVRVDMTESPGCIVDVFRRDWSLESDLDERLINDLNLKQSAECVNCRGQRLRMWVDPRKRTVGIEEIKDDEAV
jgi:hypothetical protein